MLAGIPFSLLTVAIMSSIIQKTGEHLQEVGAEYGTTTGRRRRCGWLDLVVLKHSCLINGYDSFNLTKLDVLDDLDELKIGVGYVVDGQTLDGFPGMYHSILLPICNSSTYRNRIGRN